MSRLGSTNETIARIRDYSDACILFCSLGKDSLVCLDLIYPRFKRVICVFMYFVKGLDHIEHWVGWVKAKYPNIEFVQVPHWNLTYLLRAGIYCVPQPKIKLLKLADVIKAVRLKYGVNPVVLGMKKADGMNRRLMLNTYAENDYINNWLCYPLAEWTQRDVLAYMKQHNLPEPVRYSKNASGGVGFNVECFTWLRMNFPRDLEKIYKTFPMSQRILIEQDYKTAKESNGIK